MTATELGQGIATALAVTVTVCIIFVLVALTERLIRKIARQRHK